MLKIRKETLTNHSFMNKLKKDRKRLGTKRVRNSSFSERGGHRLEAALKEFSESAFGS